MGADLVMAAAAGPSLPLPRLWDRLRRRMAAMAAGESAGRERAADREAVNRQAERMLTDYGGSVLRLAYSYLHNLSDAEEVLQDTLIRFLRTAPALESAAHERAWLLRAAANLSKNRLRYNRVRRTDELNEELAAAVRSLRELERGNVEIASRLLREP